MNRKWLLFLVILFCLLGISSTFWLWYMKGTRTLDVLIVDKTVPDDTYSNHVGITWLLNNEKYKQSSGKPYRVDADYAGFKPASNGDFSINKLPDNLSQIDVIYLSNLYGVDKDSYLQQTIAEGESRKLYGGLDPIEYEAIRNKLLTTGGTLIGERDVLDLSSTIEVRNGMATLMNVEWTGWRGKYYADLSASEVEGWLVANHTTRNGQSWGYQGSGIILVNEYTGDMLVLSGDDLQEAQDLVKFKYMKQGEQQLGLSGEEGYLGWFNIINASNQEEVLATFSLNVTETGKNKLEQRYIPEQFAAIVNHRNNKYNSFYFSGEFSRVDSISEIYQSEFYTWLKKFSNWHDREDAFFWKIYVPLMKSVLKEGQYEPVTSKDIEHVKVDDISYHSRASGNYLQIVQDGQWVDFVVKGINLGMGKPGAFPGEAAIGRDEYYRWFVQMGDMNVNALRVYTLQPPGFYEALYEYNQTVEDPIYLFHGAWVLEEEIEVHKNMFEDSITVPYYEEITNVIRAVHGDTTIEKRAGHAYGEYKYDVSPYLLGWILGIEWYGDAVAGTNDKNAGKEQFKGKFVYTQDASPFEIWLAQSMEYTAMYEYEHYQTQHLLSFTNWPTTDMLEHPLESNPNEDLAVVNPNHIYTSDDFYPGLFASYHIYPHYPDFIDNEFYEYVDHRGESNAYAGYLNALKEKHQMPIIVAEFGIAGSRGITHLSVDGRDQGGHSEQEQGQYLAGLYEDIIQEGYAGGMIFIWQDEWFKKTWNTADYDNPDRRPYWANIQTNEQFFGMMSFEPGQYATTIDIDGRIHDWERQQVKPIYEAATTDRQNLKRLYMLHDYKYLYLRLDYEQLDAQAIDTSIMLDTIAGQGNKDVPGASTVKQPVGFDFHIQLQNDRNAEMFVDSYYDSYYYTYNALLKMIPDVDYDLTPNSGVYHPIRLMLKRASSVELDDGTVVNYPLEYDVTGKLQHGNSHPQSDSFNTLADYYVNEENGVIEVRIPWLMLNYKDPSQHEIIGNLWNSTDGSIPSAESQGIRAIVVSHSKGQDVPELLPAANGQLTITEDQLKRYTWEKWDYPLYHERLKASYYIMRDLYATY